MKKLLTLAALIGTASLSFGQGYVGFANTSTTRVSTNGTALNPPQGTGLSANVAGSYYFALLVAPSTQNTVDNSLTGWTFVGGGTNTATLGRMNGNSFTDSSAVQVAGFGTTATADFVVVGWSANLGPDFTALKTWWNNGSPTPTSTTYFAISAVANDILLAPSGGPYNNVWGPTVSGQIPGMTLIGYNPVPEPTSFALAGLGAAALMIFRRRK